MASGIFTLKEQNQFLRQNLWDNSTQKTSWVEYLVVAGGGGGGSNIGPGAGAGGLLQGLLRVASGSLLTVTVGAGGPEDTNGANSVFSSVIALGGAGGLRTTVALSGGSGAGSAFNSFPGQGTFLQGNPGGTAGGVGDANNYGSGGGGGAGTAGVNGIQVKSGDGGSGIASAISGTITVYAGGGGATSSAFNTGGSGGIGGGGAGAQNASYPFSGSNGTANTGGGGGGGTRGGGNGGSGGSGIVIVRYPSTFPDASSVSGGTKTTANGYTIYTFLTSGSITL